jgi:1,4-alpha-glucan branching enzyme
MAGHPGKMLMFMGQEFGQYKEWSYKSGLDWDVLQFEEHAQMHAFVEAINAFYLKSSELWENESDWSGFSWVVPDDNQNSVIIFRRINSSGDELIVVCNFLPREHEEYTFGVPYEGDYTEVFSTDAREFGGNGLLNGTVTAVRARDLMHGEPFALTVKIAPMSGLFLKPVRKSEKAKSATDIQPKKAETNF